MNNKMKKINMLLSALLLVCSVSCTDYLEEENLGNQTADKFFPEAAGYESLVNSVYSGLRSPFDNPNLFVWGTDIFQSGGNGNGFDVYNASLNAQEGLLRDFWNQLYASIKNANAAVERADKVVDMDPLLKETRLGEVKFLRAFYYFHLVRTYGNVPLVLNEFKTADISCSRDPEATIYEQILKDLQEAVEVLPLEQDQYGRVTKGAAQHLLAKVFLTRGYQDFGEANDFQKAAVLAEEVINSGQYSLLPNFADVFAEGNEVNEEVIFAVQYNEDPISNGDGSSLHTRYTFDYRNFPGLVWSNEYGTPFSGHIPTNFLYSLFDKAKDARYDATFRTLYIANQDDPENGLSVGDTAIYFPSTPWAESKKSTVNYVVANAEDYDQYLYPSIEKFKDTKAPYLNSAQGRGYRDQFLFRLAETYLIAAEAKLMAENLDEGVEYINEVRRRAAEAGNEAEMEISADQLTIDFILDERARELAGEMHRWYDLKRTEKLMERAYAHNEMVQSWGMLSEYHLVRPIPQEWLNLCPGEDGVKQNNGY